MIEINNVSFDYGREQGTLREVSLRVEPGECILLCGESGCGKTTVTKLINGLIPHFIEGGALTGSVTAAGLPVADTEMYRLAVHVGSVFQNPKSQFFNLDADSEIIFGLENAGVEPAIMRARLAATVRELRIEALLGRSIFALSGGEKQTLAFASVYAMNPDIFVLDEPTANLDARAIETLRRQIRRVTAEGRTVVIAEHRLYFLTDLIDRAVYLRDGRIARSFTGAEFRGLSEEARMGMGLRCLAPSRLALAPCDPPGSGSGLSVEGLCCAYEKQEVFRGVGFSTGYGQVLGVVGFNGAGKTTLTRCLCGLQRESAGTVRLDGRPLNRKARSRACFSIMQDVNHQLFSDSVWNECELAAPGCAPERIEAVLESFGLLALRERHPMALSGGQKQRLAVATAVLTDKQVLIFDEPTSGLDYRHMVEVGRIVRRLAEEEKRIVLIVSHDYEFLGRICDKLLSIESAENGRRGDIGILSEPDRLRAEC